MWVSTLQRGATGSETGTADVSINLEGRKLMVLAGSLGSLWAGNN